MVSVPRPAGEYQGRPPSFLPHPAAAKHPTAITTKPSLRTAIMVESRSATTNPGSSAVTFAGLRDVRDAAERPGELHCLQSR
ncbi:hypothetical protein ACWDNI_26700 [Nocardia niigatensis]